MDGKLKEMTMFSTTAICLLYKNLRFFKNALKSLFRAFHKNIFLRIYLIFYCKIHRSWWSTYTLLIFWPFK